MSSVSGPDSVSLPCQVLVLDDEPLILLDLECAVMDAGCIPLTAMALDEALDIVRRNSLTTAILDVSLGKGQTCAAVARELAARGVPYVFHTGDIDRMDGDVRALGGLVVPKPTPACVVVAFALQGLNVAPHLN